MVDVVLCGRIPQVQACSKDLHAGEVTDGPTRLPPPTSSSLVSAAVQRPEWRPDHFAGPTTGWQAHANLEPRTSLKSSLAARSSQPSNEQLAQADDDLDDQSLRTVHQHPKQSFIMGRLHSNGKGISASAIPYSRSAPSWLKTTPDQVVDQICKLAKKGATPSQIGVILRDSHGIAQVKVVTGMLCLAPSRGTQRGILYATTI